MYLLVEAVVVNSAAVEALPFQQDLTIDQASDVIIDGYLVDCTDIPINITGATLKFNVKRHPADDGYGVIDKTATIVNGPSGYFRFTLTNADTNLMPAHYVYQVTYISVSNTRDYPIPTSAFDIIPVLEP